jgi:hypothetical protein
MGLPDKQATDDIPAGERDRRPGDRGVVVLAIVQAYVVTAYLAAAVVPYLWRHREAPPTWMWIVPRWLLGVPGFWVTLLGPFLAVPLAVYGLSRWRQHRREPDQSRWWVATTAVLMTVFAVYTLTPPAFSLWTFVVD